MFTQFFFNNFGYGDRYHIILNHRGFSPNPINKTVTVVFKVEMYLGLRVNFCFSINQGLNLGPNVFDTLSNQVG